LKGKGGKLFMSCSPTNVLPLKGKFVVFYDTEKNDILVKPLLAAAISEPGIAYGGRIVKAVHLTFERERGVVAIADYGKSWASARRCRPSERTGRQRLKNGVRSATTAAKKRRLRNER
jgi:hypothetical protein